MIDSISMQEIGSKNYSMMPITSYLKDGTLPNGKEVVRKLKVQATQFVLIKDILYKKGLLLPVPEVSYLQRGRLCHVRSPQRNLRKPFWITVLGA